jgi:hypothetical protein
MNRAATAETAAVCPPAAAVNSEGTANRTERAVDGELTAVMKWSSVH